MSTPTTRQTLDALRAIGGLVFSPLGRSDRSLYAGAGDDALIASGEDASLIYELTGEPCETGPGTLDVVISEGRIELYACKPDGEQVVAHLTVGEGF